MTKRDFGLILAGTLLSAGIIFLVVGFMYRDGLGKYIQAKYIPPVFVTPKEVNRDFVIDIIDRTNIEREKANREPLKKNSALSYAAYLRAKEILEDQNFSHYASRGGEVKVEKAIQMVGYGYGEIGENLAKGFDDPNAVIEGWLNSPEHKENMLKGSYREIGASVLTGNFQGENNTNIIVQLFGAR